MNIPDENKIINGLWIGSSLSVIEQLCITSFINKGHVFRLWTYDETIKNVPEGTLIADAKKIIPQEEVFHYVNKNQYGHGQGSYAGFSDIFRYKLLYELGGWWSDMDIVCLKPLDFDSPFVFRTHHIYPAVGNIIKCPAGHLMMRDCYTEAKEIINKHNNDWDLPIKILNKYIEKYDLKSFIVSICNDDKWEEVKKVFYKNKINTQNWYVIHLMNEEWKKNHISKDGSYLKYCYLSRLIKENKIKINTSWNTFLKNTFNILNFRKYMIELPNKMRKFYWFAISYFWKIIRIFFKEKKDRKDVFLF